MELCWDDIDEDELHLRCDDDTFTEVVVARKDMTHTTSYYYNYVALREVDKPQHNVLNQCYATIKRH